MTPSTANIYITATDMTQKAFNSIKVGALALVAVFGTIGIAVEQNLKKFADLNDFDNFGVARENALAFVDTLKLSGGTMENATKAYSDLSTKVSEGLGDPKIAKTFASLGISAKELKEAKIDDIMEKILDKASKTSDKAKTLSELKDIFGKNGLIIFDSSQEERATRIRAGIKAAKDEIDLASAGADTFYKGLDESRGLLENGFSRAMAVPLVGINTFIEGIIQMARETDKAKGQLELVDDVNSFKNIYLDIVDIINVLYDGMGRAIAIVKLLAQGFVVGVSAVKLLGDAIFGSITEGLINAGKVAVRVFQAIKNGLATGDVSQFGEDISNAFKVDKSKVAKNIEQGIKDVIDKSEGMDKNFEILFSAEPKILLDREKQSKLYDEIAKQTFDAANAQGKGGKENRKPPSGKEANSELLAKVEQAIKLLDRQLDREKLNLEQSTRLNDLAYGDQEITIKSFFDKKQQIEADTFAKTKAIYDAEIKLLEESLRKGLPDKDKEKAKEKLYEISNKLYKADLDYQFSKKKFDSEQKKANEEYVDKLDEIRASYLDLQGRFKEAQVIRFRIEIDKTMKGVEPEQKALVEAYLKQKGALGEVEAGAKTLNQQNEFRLAKEEAINLAVEAGRKNSFVANSEIVAGRKADIALMETQIALLQKLADADSKNVGVATELQKAKNELAKFKRDIDPIAKQINESIDGAFSTFTDDIISGNKSIKDSFNDMIGSIQKDLLKLVTKSLLDQLKGAMGLGDKDGGLGGFFSDLFGKGKATNPFGGGDKAGATSNKAVESGFTAVTDKLSTGLNSVTSSLSTSFNSIGTSLTDSFSGLGDGLSGAFGGLGDSLVSGLGSLTDSLGSALSGMFSGGGGGGGSDWISGIASIFGGAFADGGYMQGGVGKSYLVGERGPEWVTPGAGGGGYVTNARDTARMGGGGAPVIIMNVQANDVKSFNASKDQIIADMSRGMSKANSRVA